MDMFFSQPATRTRSRSLSVSEQTSATNDSKSIPPKAQQEASSNMPHLRSLAQAGGGKSQEIQKRGKKRPSGHPDSPSVSPPADKRSRPFMLKVRPSFRLAPEPAAPAQDCAVPPSHAQLAGDLKKIQKKLSNVCADLHPNDPQWQDLFTMLDLAIELSQTVSRFEAKSDHLRLRQLTAQLRQETLASLHTTLKQTLGSFSGPKTSKAKRKGNEIAEKIVTLQNRVALHADVPRAAGANAHINFSTKAMAATGSSLGPGRTQPDSHEVLPDPLDDLRSAAGALPRDAIDQYAPPPASQGAAMASIVRKDSAIVDNIMQERLREVRKTESARLLQLRKGAHALSARTLMHFSINPDGVSNQSSTEDTSISDAPAPKNRALPSFLSAAAADEACSDSASRSDSGEYPLKFPKKPDSRN